MKEYRDLIEALVGMAEISRPKEDPADDRNIRRQKRIQHGICDMMEDAAVAIDELLKRIEEPNGQDRQPEPTERRSASDSSRERDRVMCDLCEG